MVKFSTPPGLEGLFELDRKGVDIRPTLLRVLTDQYLRTPVHSPEEERTYTELAMRLIDETDIATRAAVSVRLAPHACAPRPIMLQLARDVLEVAEPVLLHSPVLTPADCQAIIVERGVCYADILARRGRPAPAATPEPVPAPPARIAATPSAAIVTAPTAPLPSAPPSPPPPVAAVEESASEAIPAEATAESADNAAAQELCELFFAAGSAERRLILMNLDYAQWPAREPPAALQRADIWRLETAALRHHTGALMREIERALSISHQQSRRIVEDERGEPIIVAGKAMSLPADVLQRIVLFMNPRVGQSVERVFELSSLYNEISIEAAHRLVSILRAAEPAGQEQKTRDARAIQGTAEATRRTLSDVATTTAVRQPEVVLRRAVGAGND